MSLSIEREPAAESRVESAVISDCARKLWNYCEERDWAGNDPYDALNSRLLEAVGLFHGRWPRLITTQLLKRCPVNIRRLLLIPPTQNPKGLALFISAGVRLSRAGIVPQEAVRSLASKLAVKRSPGQANWCWGYPFPWQTRTILFPRWQPNIICTTFAANALLDAYEYLGDESLLDQAISAAEFVLKEFYYEESGIACFSYTGLARARVHNANLLGAALLCRVAAVGNRRDLIEPAIRAARYSVQQQYPDGSWDYGDSDNPPQRWRDNFHTGFNLIALDSISRSGATTDFDDALQKGFVYYRNNFFEADGAPKYFHNRSYPYDAHAVAQSILTLIELERFDRGNVALAQGVFNWAIKHLSAPDGSFYYQRNHWFTNRISYMRWTQAWMALGVSSLLSGLSGGSANTRTREQFD